MKVSYLLFVLLVAYVVSEEECEKGTGFFQCATCDPNNKKLCGTCHEGKYLKDGKCLECYDVMVGCTKCAVENKCDSCEETYLLENGKCIPPFKKINDCTKFVQPEKTLCEECAAGFFVSTDKKKCEKCVANCIKCSDATTCDNCAINYYWKDGKCNAYPNSCQTVQDGKCTVCKNGFYLDNGNCNSCPERCTSCNSTTFCTNCKEGSTKINNTCTACDVQNCNYCAEGNPKECTACKAGFLLTTNQTKCEACTVQNCQLCADGNPKECKLCNPGFLLTTNNTKCEACSPNCFWCTEKTAFSFLNADTKCVSCNHKFFVKDDKCNSCPDQNCDTCDPASEGKNCITCSSGYFSTKDNTLPCKKCSDKYEKCESCEESKCKTCPSGYTLLHAKCAPADIMIPYCAEGTVSSCSQCKSGHNKISSVRCSASGYLKISAFMLLFALLFI